MTGDVTLRSPAISPVRTDRKPGSTRWQRRTIEVLVSLVAFAAWGTLAYKGVFRVLARVEGVPIGGHWLLDVLSLVIGVSGSIAGVSAVWALVRTWSGRAPTSLVGAPDDGPDDVPRVRR